MSQIQDLYDLGNEEQSPVNSLPESPRASRNEKKKQFEETIDTMSTMYSITNESNEMFVKIQNAFRNKLQNPDIKQAGELEQNSLRNMDPGTTYEYANQLASLQVQDIQDAAVLNDQFTSEEELLHTALVRTSDPLGLEEQSVVGSTGMSQLRNDVIRSLKPFQRAIMKKIKKTIKDNSHDIIYSSSPHLTREVIPNKQKVVKQLLKYGLDRINFRQDNEEYIIAVNNLIRERRYEAIQLARKNLKQVSDTSFYFASKLYQNDVNVQKFHQLAQQTKLERELGLMNKYELVYKQMNYRLYKVLSNNYQFLKRAVVFQLGIEMESAYDHISPRSITTLLNMYDIILVVMHIMNSFIYTGLTNGNLEIVYNGGNNEDFLTFGVQFLHFIDNAIHSIQATFKPREVIRNNRKVSVGTNGFRLHDIITDFVRQNIQVNQLKIQEQQREEQIQLKAQQIRDYISSDLVGRDLTRSHQFLDISGNVSQNIKDRVAYQQKLDMEERVRQQQIELAEKSKYSNEGYNRAVDDIRSGLRDQVIRRFGQAPSQQPVVVPQDNVEPHQKDLIIPSSQTEGLDPIVTPKQKSLQDKEEEIEKQSESEQLGWGASFWQKTKNIGKKAAGALKDAKAKLDNKYTKAAAAGAAALGAGAYLYSKYNQQYTGDIIDDIGKVSEIIETCGFDDTLDVSEALFKLQQSSNIQDIVSNCASFEYAIREQLADQSVNYLSDFGRTLASVQNTEIDGEQCELMDVPAADVVKVPLMSNPVGAIFQNYSGNPDGEKQCIIDHTLDLLHVKLQPDVNQRLRAAAEAFNKTQQYNQTIESVQHDIDLNYVIQKAVDDQTDTVDTADNSNPRLIPNLKPNPLGFKSQQEGPQQIKVANHTDVYNDILSDLNFKTYNGYITNTEVTAFEFSAESYRSFKLDQYENRLKSIKAIKEIIPFRSRQYTAQQIRDIKVPRSRQYKQADEIFGESFSEKNPQSTSPFQIFISRMTDSGMSYAVRGALKTTLFMCEALGVDESLPEFVQPFLQASVPSDSDYQFKPLNPNNLTGVTEKERQEILNFATVLKLAVLLDSVIQENHLSYQSGDIDPVIKELLEYAAPELVSSYASQHTNGYIDYYSTKFRSLTDSERFRSALQLFYQLRGVVSWDPRQFIQTDDFQGTTLGMSLIYGAIQVGIPIELLTVAGGLFLTDNQMQSVIKTTLYNNMVLQDLQSRSRVRLFYDNMYIYLLNHQFHVDDTRMQASLFLAELLSGNVDYLATGWELNEGLAFLFDSVLLGAQLAQHLTFFGIVNTGIIYLGRQTARSLVQSFFGYNLSKTTQEVLITIMEMVIIRKLNSDQGNVIRNMNIQGGAVPPPNPRQVYQVQQEVQQVFQELAQNAVDVQNNQADQIVQGIVDDIIVAAMNNVPGVPQVAEQVGAAPPLPNVAVYQNLNAEYGQMVNAINRQIQNVIEHVGQNNQRIHIDIRSNLPSFKFTGLSGLFRTAHLFVNGSPMFQQKDGIIEPPSMSKVLDMDVVEGKTFASKYKVGFMATEYTRKSLFLKYIVYQFEDVVFGDIRPDIVDEFYERVMQSSAFDGYKIPNVLINRLEQSLGITVKHDYQLSRIREVRQKKDSDGFFDDMFDIGEQLFDSVAELIASEDNTVGKIPEPFQDENRSPLDFSNIGLRNSTPHKLNKIDQALFNIISERGLQLLNQDVIEFDRTDMEFFMKRYQKVGKKKLRDNQRNLTVTSTSKSQIRSINPFEVQLWESMDNNKYSKTISKYQQMYVIDRLNKKGMYLPDNFDINKALHRSSVKYISGLQSLDSVKKNTDLVQFLDQAKIEGNSYRFRRYIKRAQSYRGRAQLEKRLKSENEGYIDIGHYLSGFYDVERGYMSRLYDIMDQDTVDDYFDRNHDEVIHPENQNPFNDTSNGLDDLEDYYEDIEEYVKPTQDIEVGMNIKENGDILGDLMDRLIRLKSVRKDSVQSFSIGQSIKKISGRLRQELFELGLQGSQLDILLFDLVDHIDNGGSTTDTIEKLKYITQQFDGVNIPERMNNNTDLSVLYRQFPVDRYHRSYIEEQIEDGNHLYINYYLQLLRREINNTGQYDLKSLESFQRVDIKLMSEFEENIQSPAAREKAKDIINQNQYQIDYVNNLDYIVKFNDEFEAGVLNQLTPDEKQYMAQVQQELPLMHQEARKFYSYSTLIDQQLKDRYEAYHIQFEDQRYKDAILIQDIIQNYRGAAGYDVQDRKENIINSIQEQTGRQYDGDVDPEVSLDVIYGALPSSPYQQLLKLTGEDLTMYRFQQNSILKDQFQFDLIIENFLGDSARNKAYEFLKENKKTQDGGLFIPEQYDAEIVEHILKKDDREKYLYALGLVTGGAVATKLAPSPFNLPRLFKRMMDRLAPGQANDPGQEVELERIRQNLQDNQLDNYEEFKDFAENADPFDRNRNDEQPRNDPYPEEEEKDDGMFKSALRGAAKNIAGVGGGEIMSQGKVRMGGASQILVSGQGAIEGAINYQTQVQRQQRYDDESQRLKEKRQRQSQVLQEVASSPDVDLQEYERIQFENIAQGMLFLVEQEQQQMEQEMHEEQIVQDSIHYQAQLQQNINNRLDQVQRDYQQVLAQANANLDNVLQQLGDSGIQNQYGQAQSKPGLSKKRKIDRSSRIKKKRERVFEEVQQSGMTNEDREDFLQRIELISSQARFQQTSQRYSAQRIEQQRQVLQENSDRQHRRRVQNMRSVRLGQLTNNNLKDSVINMFNNLITRISGMPELPVIAFYITESLFAYGQEQLFDPIQMRISMETHSPDDANMNSLMMAYVLSQVGPLLQWSTKMVTKNQKQSQSDYLRFASIEESLDINKGNKSDEDVDRIYNEMANEVSQLEDQIRQHPLSGFGDYDSFNTERSDVTDPSFKRKEIKRMAMRIGQAVSVLLLLQSMQVQHQEKIMFNDNIPGIKKDIQNIYQTVHRVIKMVTQGQIPATRSNLTQSTIRLLDRRADLISQFFKRQYELSRLDLYLLLYDIYEIDKKLHYESINLYVDPLSFDKYYDRKQFYLTYMRELYWRLDQSDRSVLQKKDVVPEFIVQGQTVHNNMIRDAIVKKKDTIEQVKDGINRNIRQQQLLMGKYLNLEYYKSASRVVDPSTIELFSGKMLKSAWDKDPNIAPQPIIPPTRKFTKVELDTMTRSVRQSAEMIMENRKVRLEKLAEMEKRNKEKLAQINQSQQYHEESKEVPQLEFKGGQSASDKVRPFSKDISLPNVQYDSQQSMQDVPELGVNLSDGDFDIFNRPLDEIKNLITQCGFEQIMAEGFQVEHIAQALVQYNSPAVDNLVAASTRQGYQQWISDVQQSSDFEIAMAITSQMAGVQQMGSDYQRLFYEEVQYNHGSVFADLLRDSSQQYDGTSFVIVMHALLFGARPLANLGKMMKQIGLKMSMLKSSIKQMIQRLQEMTKQLEMRLPLFVQQEEELDKLIV